MKLNKNAIIYFPERNEGKNSLKSITHLAIAAHQDDVEFMAYAPISDCYMSEKEKFGAVIVSDGAGSPRAGKYADFTDEDMKQVRILEQKKAADIGKYSALLMLSHPSKQIKNPEDSEITEELVRVLKETSPRYVYTHNIADKHNTHVGVAVKVINALRELEPENRPEKVFGCESWRGLDWLSDEDKVLLDTGKNPKLAMSLSSVFDSQIAGGKRYDLACEGRRLANATFLESHAVDEYKSLSYAMDLTPLMLDKSLSIVDFICGHIRKLEKEVCNNLLLLTKEK